ncbi:MAG: DUF4783 domain-containing protein [Salinibacter sp.]|uniref:DUF4783 domain-containing protein n=1 Tax=Salinibacter sp. TaxID=2065818 RepID=UPI002FC3D3D5
MSVSRSLVVVLLFGLGGAPSVAQGQPADSIATVSDSTTEGPPAVARRVATAFSDGDARRLLTPSADRVEISLFGNRTFYSSSQAVYVLREFFRRHTPGRFVVGDVTEAGASYFVRGEYEEARRVRRHRVYVRLDQPDGEELWNLHELRIEHASE